MSCTLRSSLTSSRTEVFLPVLCHFFLWSSFAVWFRQIQIDVFAQPDGLLDSRSSFPTTASDFIRTAQRCRRRITDSVHCHSSWFWKNVSRDVIKVQPWKRSLNSRGYTDMRSVRQQVNAESWHNQLSNIRPGHSLYRATKAGSLQSTKWYVTDQFASHVKSLMVIETWVECKSLSCFKR